VVNIAPNLIVHSSAMLLLITLEKLECARMVQRHTKSYEVGQKFKNEIGGSRTGTAHTQMWSTFFFFLI